jgi:hypothetical protein
VAAIVSIAAQDARYTVPRTPWGDPDLQGLWPGTAMMGVPMERPPVSVGALGRGGPGSGIGIGPPGHWGERGTPQKQAALVVDPPDGRIPPMSEAGRRRTAAVPNSWYYDNNDGGPLAAPTDLSAYDRCITRAFAQRCAAPGRALHAHRTRHAAVLGDNRRPADVDAAVDDVVSAAT